MKSWKPGLQDREWGASQGMLGIVVKDVPLHRSPPEFPEAPGGGRRWTHSPVNDPARKGDWLHFFSSLGVSKSNEEGQRDFEVTLETRSRPPLATGCPRCPY